MGKFTVTKTTLADAIVITPTAFADNRGYFMESYNEQDFLGIGIGDHFVQDNHSHSRQGVLRGMHFQVPPHAIAKLVRCLAGEVFDVIVDMRPSSPTFKKWESFTLTAENKKMLYVPVGFGHGFCAMSPTADFAYKVTGCWEKAWDGGFRWNDPEIGIVWQNANPILTEKDATFPFFSEIADTFK